MFNKKLFLIFGMFFIFAMMLNFGSASFGFDQLNNPNIDVWISNSSVFEHNNLTDIQGGVSEEYYHIRESWFNELTSDIFDWITQSEGDARYYELTDFNINNYLLKSEWNATNSSYRTLSNLTFSGGNSVFLESVGIGTSSPDEKLVVYGTIKAGNSTDLSPTATGEGHIRIDGNGYDGFITTDGSAMYLGHNSAGRRLDLMTNEISRVSIKGDGNVGIGTTSPGEELEISNDNAKVKLSNPSNPSSYYATFEQNYNYVGPSFVISSASGGVPIQVLGRYGDNLAIMKDGDNVGIGTTSPSYPLEINGDSSGISLYTSGNISATGFITRTSLFDKSKNVWDYVKDADYYKDKDGEIDHSKYYGYVQNITSTDYSKPINESYEEEVCTQTLENVTVEKCSWIEDIFTNCTEVIEEQLIENCHNETKTRITYPYTKQEEGVNLESEINLLRQAIYELKQQNDLLISRIEVLENVK